MPRNKKNYSHARRKPLTKKLQTKVGQKNRNAGYIKRSKAAEEALRHQTQLEANYTNEKVDSACSTSEDENEDNAFQNLLSTFREKDQDGQWSGNDKYLQRKWICDSSDDTSDFEEGKEEVGMEGEEEEVSSLKDDEEKYNQNNEDSSDDDSYEDIEMDKEDLSQNVCEVSMIDTFSTHFYTELQENSIENILNQTSIKKLKLSWLELGNLLVEIPTWTSSESHSIKDQEISTKKQVLISDDTEYAQAGIPPEQINCSNIDLSKNIVSQILPNVHVANSLHLKGIDEKQPLSQLQCDIFSVLRNYQDLYYPHRVLSNAEEIRFIYCMHILNHALKSRSKVVRHNAKLASSKQNDASVIASDKYRDQGLVRPRILIIVPFKDSVYRIINNFISILYGEKHEMSKENGSVINYKRFVDEYTGDTIRFPKQNPKPVDYEKTFAGNTDDTFRIGIALTKKCIKLYTEFYSSDILIASPLGLRMIIGADGDEERDYDFLSSIEILVLDQAELFFAQNWDHLLHVMDHLHLQPKSVERTDFSRVRRWCLNGFAKFYRQTLLFTSHELPEFRSLFNKYFVNYSGKIRTCNPVVKGTVSHVSMHIPQIFHKIEVTTLQSSFDTRFKYFIKEILPQYSNSSMAHCLIFVPSYFDYIRLRNYFKAECLNFVQINEYTKDSKIARARDMFFHSSAHFLLYSERAHFFRRTRIKGIRHLIMYAPPCWPNLYAEMINLMQDGNQNPRDGLDTSMTITVLYTKYDILTISSIVSTSKAAVMLQSNKRTHLLTTKHDL